MNQQKSGSKNVNKAKKDACVNTEQIGADGDGDKVMKDKTFDDDYAKLHCIEVSSKAGGLHTAVNKVENIRPRLLLMEGR